MIPCFELCNRCCIRCQKCIGVSCSSCQHCTSTCCDKSLNCLTLCCQGFFDTMMNCFSNPIACFLFIDSFITLIPSILMIYTLTESSSYACYHGFTKTALLIQGINNGLNFIFCIYLSSIIGSKEKEPDTESNIGYSSRISNNNQQQYHSYLNDNSNNNDNNNQNHLNQNRQLDQNINDIEQNISHSQNASNLTNKDDKNQKTIFQKILNLIFYDPIVFVYFFAFMFFSVWIFFTYSAYSQEPVHSICYKNQGGIVMSALFLNLIAMAIFVIIGWNSFVVVLIISICAEGSCVCSQFCRYAVMVLTCCCVDIDESEEKNTILKENQEEK